MLLRSPGGPGSLGEGALADPQRIYKITIFGPRPPPDPHRHCVGLMLHPSVTLLVAQHSYTTKAFTRYLPYKERPGCMNAAPNTESNNLDRNGLSSCARVSPCRPMAHSDSGHCRQLCPGALGQGNPTSLHAMLMPFNSCLYADAGKRAGLSLPGRRACKGEDSAKQSLPGWSFVALGKQRRPQVASGINVYKSQDSTPWQ